MWASQMSLVTLGPAGTEGAYDTGQQLQVCKELRMRVWAGAVMPDGTTGCITADDLAGDRWGEGPRNGFMSPGKSTANLLYLQVRWKLQQKPHANMLI